MKLNRNDLLAVAVQRLQADVAAELEAATVAEQTTRAEFQRSMRGMILVERADVFDKVANFCGTSTGRMEVDMLLEPTDDVLADPPAYVDVVIRDGATYEARVVLRTRYMAHDSMLAWFEAVRRKQAAEARAVRVSKASPEARAAMVGELLDNTEEGKAMLAQLGHLLSKVATCETTTEPVTKSSEPGT